jgi:predicted nucleic acid-binding protein
MPKISALLDTNVLIASLVEAHEHHTLSLNLLLGSTKARFAVAAHSYAETYGTLTRRDGSAPFQFTPRQACAALESVRALTALVGLTPAQTFDAIRGYALGDGAGHRLYDRLIGEVAITHAIPQIVTWNAGAMRTLFPGLHITTPKAFQRTAITAAPS